ncbi:hypothetical protein NC651_015918 [Populus alba x Populus x berolinensis]|nr:hypothetical protein NC651_015918 [Populus alba x Populus x berolinensis]
MEQDAQKVKGHTKPIHSVCWDLLVSFWHLPVRTLSESGRLDQEVGVVYHSPKPALFLLPLYVVFSTPNNCPCWIQSLELWNMNENKTMTLSAHEGLIAALAVSTATGLVASASHDKLVKLWK